MTWHSSNFSTLASCLISLKVIPFQKALSLLMGIIIVFAKWPPRLNVVYIRFRLLFWLFCKFIRSLSSSSMPLLCIYKLFDIKLRKNSSGFIQCSTRKKNAVWNRDFFFVTNGKLSVCALYAQANESDYWRLLNYIINN